MGKGTTPSRTGKYNTRPNPTQFNPLTFLRNPDPPKPNHQHARLRTHRTSPIAHQLLRKVLKQRRLQHPAPQPASTQAPPLEARVAVPGRKRREQETEHVVRQGREAEGGEEGVDFHVAGARGAGGGDGSISGRRCAERRRVLAPESERDGRAEVQGARDVGKEEGGAEVVCWRGCVGVQRRSEGEGREEGIHGCV